MGVLFLKDHLHYKKGDTATIDEGIAFYLINMGVCEQLKKKEKKQM